MVRFMAFLGATGVFQKKIGERWDLEGTLLC